MIRYLVVFAMGVIVGCPPPGPPAPVPPDGSDAAPIPVPTPTPTTPPPGPQTPCSAACDVLAKLGCPEGAATDCSTVLAHIDGSRFVREPSGRPLSCADIASAKTVTGVRALGISCGVGP